MRESRHIQGASSTILSAGETETQSRPQCSLVELRQLPALVDSVCSRLLVADPVY